MKSPAKAKTWPAKRSAAKPVAAAKPAARVKRATAKKNPPATTPAAPPPTAAAPTEVLKELKEIRALLSPPAASAATPDAALESGVTSVRRLLSDLMVTRLDSVMAGLVAIRASATQSVPRTLEQLDRLLGDLGAVRFGATRLDYVDPLIHAVHGERQEASAPDGVVLETVRPGYKTARGVVLAKAAVIVNRRD